MGTLKSVPNQDGFFYFFQQTIQECINFTICSYIKSCTYVKHILTVSSRSYATPKIHGFHYIKYLQYTFTMKQRQSRQHVKINPPSFPRRRANLPQIQHSKSTDNKSTPILIKPPNVNNNNKIVLHSILFFILIKDSHHHLHRYHHHRHHHHHHHYHYHLFSLRHEIHKGYWQTLGFVFC